MFKRSLASVAAVAIASGAVVAPANAVTVTVNKDDMTCTFNFTAEETKLTHSHPTPKFPKEEAATIRAKTVEPQLLELRAQIKKDKEALNNPDLDEEQRKDLTIKLKENEKKLTAFENYKDALTACINGKAYNSDKSGDSKNPEGQVKPGGQDQSGGTDQSGDSKNPEGQGKPGTPGNPGDSNNPKAPSNPGAQPAPPSTDGAGIGVIFAGAIAAILGILAAALPIIKPMLPPQLRALLP
ncbi:hypothetical protein CIP107527_02099 [Corynebacterium diphtheriae]|nr:hypothetical protein CIP107527_02099 [Corynebacterium diphtheriae]